MDFELRVIGDCPNSAPALELYLRALACAGLEATDLVVRELGSEREALELGFQGSPTFVAGGRDLFPSAAAPALTCRVYPGAAGFSGLPTLDGLRAALRGFGGLSD